MPDIQTLAVADLKPWPRNARLHSRQQVKQLAHSIRRFGFTHPILIDEDNYILSGHGRVRAAQDIGLADVPCVRIAHLSPAEKRAYVLADNKLALSARWDQKLLADELKCLLAEDITVDTGFSVVEIESLIADGKTPDARKGGGIGDAPKRCRAGDTWRLGPHWLVCGETLRPDMVTALTTGQLVQMVITRPGGTASSPEEAGDWAGATLLSADKAGRRMVLSEGDALRCDRIIQHWEACTKVPAIRFNSRRVTA